MKLIDNQKPKRFTRRALLRTGVYSSIALTGGIAYTQSDNLEVIKQDVPIKGLPASLNGLSIGVMSDLHAGAWGNEKVIYKSVEAMQKLKPDIITLLGDYVDGAKSHNKQNIENGMFIFDALSSLEAPMGTYSVLGNHEHWTDSKRVTQLLTERGITVLVDEHRELPNGLVLAGVDDYWSASGDQRKAIEGVKDKPVVLLSHNPDINEILLPDDPINLVIAGHTHGGQIRIPFTGWAPWVPCSDRYKGTTGLFREATGWWSFITKGIGTFLIPVRLSCPPDIALLTLRKA